MPQWGVEEKKGLTFKIAEFMNSKKLHLTPDEIPAGQFTHINDGFICEACGKKVLPRSTSCRNHCPFCLVSKHVDVFPGDRLNPCQGLMDLSGYEMSAKKGLVLRFKCRRCGWEGRNVAAHEDSNQPDRYDIILAKGSLRP